MKSFLIFEFVGKVLYKADWVEGLNVWDYALGKRVQYQNTPVALKVLIKSENISKNFLEVILSHPLSLLGYYPFSNRNYDEYLIKEICEETNPLRPKVLKGTPPETVNQFITNNSEVSDETHTFNNDQFASKLITLEAIKNHKDDKIVDTNSVDIDNNDDETDEWNTLHVNDYQNWLYNFDIMCDYSEETIASIVNKNIPQLEFNETRAFEKPIIMKNKSTNVEEKNRLLMKKKNLTSMWKLNRVIKIFFVSCWEMRSTEYLLHGIT
ncbi:kinase-like protein [Gigaspora margarita]|uniref:Kinase-like protein n=1 Tax=Gigaspora margarita TaxID=4874 RepID=A0A8H4AVQ1_GIGMA|nr:kinase-like protein [Gigaspora margarita]